MNEPTPVPPWAGAAPAPFAEPAPERQSRWKLGVVAAVSAVVVIGGGVAVANAATSSPAAGQQGAGGPGGYGRPGGQGFPGGVQGGAGAGQGFPGGAGNELGRALHGEYVIKDSTGKFVTERMISGTVTAVSATSVTAKSEDGYEATFAVDAATKVDGGNGRIADVKTGDTVNVVGTAGTATAITTRTGQAGGQPPR